MLRGNNPHKSNAHHAVSGSRLSENKGSLLEHELEVARRTRERWNRKYRYGNGCSIAETKGAPFDGAKRVEVRCMVMKITSIDTVNQTFTIDFLLQASWTDFGMKTAELDKKKKEARAAAPTAPAGAFSVDNAEWVQRNFWTPKLELRNVLRIEPGPDPSGQDSVEEWYRVWDENPADPSDPATVAWHYRAHACFMEHFELQVFPVDVQDLQMFVQCGYSNGLGTSCRAPRSRSACRARPAAAVFLKTGCVAPTHGLAVAKTRQSQACNLLAGGLRRTHTASWTLSPPCR